MRETKFQITASVNTYYLKTLSRASHKDEFMQYLILQCKNKHFSTSIAHNALIARFACIRTLSCNVMTLRGLCTMTTALVTIYAIVTIITICNINFTIYL